MRPRPTVLSKMALSPCDIPQHKALLRLVIDDGTGEMKVAGQFFPAHPTSQTPTPFTIRLNGQLSVAQKAVLEDNLDTGTLIWGDRDVNLWRRHNPRRTNEACQLWKLALSEVYRDSPTARAVFRAIGAEHGNMEDIEEFTTIRLRRLHAEIIDRLVSNHTTLADLAEGADAKHYWENEVEIETLLMVPAKWSQDAQSIMIAAATDTGFTNVGVVYESLVAVASELHRLEENRHVRVGDVIVVLDIGQGTVDISTAMIEESTRILKLVGDYSTCGLAGSQLVNDLFGNTCSLVPRFFNKARTYTQSANKWGIRLKNSNFLCLTKSNYGRPTSQRSSTTS